MIDRVVTSGNGYYVYERAGQSGNDAPPRYEVRQGNEIVRTCESLSEAQEFIEYAYGREEENYKDA